MKVLLIRPKPHKDTIGLQNVMICEPLELEYISSNIENLGHKAIIVDMILERKSISYFLDKYKPDVVGITGYISHVNIIKNYAKQIKDYDRNIKTIVGGVHAEVNPEDFVSKNIDYIIRANGIKTFIDILDKLENKENSNYIECVYHKNDKKIEKETEFNYLFPDRDKVKKYRSKYYYMFHRNCSLMKTSFGCPYQCKFCFCRQITDGKYFTRDLNNIIEELKTIKETEIYIVDDDFLVNDKRILEFCDLLEKNNIKKKYLIYGRADFIANNEDIMKELSEIGLSLVMVGLESTDNNELDSYNKRTTVNDNEECIRILNKYNIICAGLFIVHQEMTKQDFKDLYNWIASKKIMPTISIFTPMQGSAIYKKYESEILDKNPKKQDLFHCILKPRYMSVGEFTREYYKLSLKLAWKNRKEELYSCVNINSVIFVLKVLLIKLRRIFIF